MSDRLLWPELEPNEEAAGWLPDFPKVTSAQVLDALAARHPMDGYNGMPGRWVFVREVQASTGAYADVQRFDAVAVGLVPSVKYARVVYEVKVSRADWLRELKPKRELTFTGRRLSHWALTDEELRSRGIDVREYTKWQAALDVSTELWFAAPPRCILPDEVPPEAGLIEVRPWGKTGDLRPRVVRPAPVREMPLPDSGFWAAVLRRVAERRPQAAEAEMAS